MLASNENCKCNLKYKVLSVIDNDLFHQIKSVFIFAKYEASDVIFVTKTDEVYGYGTNKFGRLGLGHDSNVSEPTIINELCAKSVSKIEFGQQLMVALTEAMEVYTCGYDYNGMLGNGNNSKTYRKPQKLSLIEIMVADIKCCATSAYLLTDTNEIYYFGYFPTLGSVSSPIIKNTSSNQKIVTISCGWDHVIALTSVGTAYGWGVNGYGQLGLGHNTNINDPQVIPMPENSFIKSISCGYYHSLLLTTDGQIYSFGYNNCGQLGTGDNTTFVSLKLIELEDKITEVMAFENTSMALNVNQNIVIWGQIRNDIIRSPIETSFVSFQKAVNIYTKSQFTCGPLSSDELFVANKKLNPVLEIMANAFNEEENSDLTFKLKRKESEDFGYIYGHKWFISKTSEYFQRMFANDWSENKSDEIEINSYSYEAYYQFIRCLYTDSIDCEDIEILVELLAITDEYVDDVRKTKCVQTIKPLMKVENVCSVFSSSLRNRSKELEEFCFKFMSAHISLITKTKDFDQMDSDFAKHFLQRYSETNKK